ncbi:MAG: YbhN family protein [Candidatus Limnocylindrales bacterium]
MSQDTAPRGATDAADADAAANPGTDPASAAAPPNRRSMLLRSGLIVGVLVLVFGVILPRYIDYSDVIAAFQALDAQQILIMTALGAFGWVVSGLVFRALIQGLSAVRATMSWLILAGIGSSVPFGPWNMGVLWVVIRGWGVGNAAATSGIAIYGVVNELSRLFLPLFAIVILAVTGDLTNAAHATTGWVIAIVSAIAFVVVTGLIIAIVRSERVAAWFGRTGQRIADWTRRRLGRTGSPNVAASIYGFRDQLGLVIRQRGLAALTVAVLSQFAWTIVLIAAMRVCGVPDSALSAAEIFGVYGLVMVITIIPLSPGGAGVPELLFISMFSAITGPQYQAAVTAGVFLYRIYYFFVPIPLAWLLLKVARKGRPLLPATSELRAYAKGDAGTASAASTEGALARP